MMPLPLVSAVAALAVLRVALWAPLDARATTHGRRLTAHWRGGYPPPVRTIVITGSLRNKSSYLIQSNIYTFIESGVKSVSYFPPLYLARLIAVKLYVIPAIELVSHPI